MSIRICEEARLETWQQAWNGVHWWDMPGDDSDHQKLNFALWRRGLKEYEPDDKGGFRELCPAFGRIASIQPSAAYRSSHIDVERRAEVLATLRKRVNALVAQGWKKATMAAWIGWSRTQMTKVTKELKSVSEESLKKLRNMLVHFEIQPVPVKPVKVDKRRLKVVPKGCIPYKEWLAMEARKQGMTPVALRARIDRGVVLGPEIVALNKRRHFVRIVEAAAA